MKKHKADKLLEQIKSNEEVFINYLRSRFPFFYRSNFFFRDLEYGIKTFFEKRHINISDAENLYLARELGEYFEQKDYFKKIGDGTWMINMPQFATTSPGDPF